jgi:isopentenyl phosphate kinase
MIILKLGGSVVTCKKEPFKISENLDMLTSEIAQIDKKMILVHGGGSFGHPLAKKYKIQEGYFEPNQLLGFAETHMAMQRLNDRIVKSLMEKGLPAIGIQPTGLVDMKEGEIKEIYLDNVFRLSDIGLVPVLYGVPAHDCVKKFAILSGDDIMVELAKKAEKPQVIFACDVDGVYTQGQVIKKITPSSVDRIVFDKVEGDVTGGMKAKIKKLLKIVKEGIQVQIINGLKPGNILKAIEGEEIGTLIKDD